MRIFKIGRATRITISRIPDKFTGFDYKAHKDKYRSFKNFTSTVIQERSYLLSLKNISPKLLR